MNEYRIIRRYATLVNSRIVQQKRDENFFYEKNLPDLRNFRIRPFHLGKDLPLIYEWVNMEYAKYWGMGGTSLCDFKLAYERILLHAQVFIGEFKHQPAFLIEKYDPSDDVLGHYYKAQQGDQGMHLLVAPLKTKIPNFTWNIMCTVLYFFFEECKAQRVVVEPDIGNEKIHVLNRKVGFEYIQELQLPHKNAYLAWCNKERFQVAVEKSNKEKLNQFNIKIMEVTKSEALHIEAKLLHEEHWHRANRMLLQKALSEFAHELLINPVFERSNGDWSLYKLNSGLSYVSYEFEAKKFNLDHWHIKEESIAKYENGKITALDALQFVIEFQEKLGLSMEVLPVYMEEITSTLNSLVYMLSKDWKSSEVLSGSDYQEIEQSMTAGHPCFVANSGRIGFDALDYKKYAPECGSKILLIWLAGHKSRTTYTAIDGLEYAKMIHQELDNKTVTSFTQALIDKGLDPAEYYFIPVHPWQWFNKISGIYAPDLANNRLVFLGYGPDTYLAQQSIRTFYNISSPHKFYTKTALSILNMGFVRGLSPYYMGSTPAITTWIKDIVKHDHYLQELGFTLLCEVATVGYRNLYFENLGKSLHYNKMLSALWRESPQSVLQPGQRIMTMAALLHIDFQGKSLLSEIIKSSGIHPSTWLNKYLTCYLLPLLHCFYKYELVFMPHGENLILIMENNVPVKVIMKDITEEIMVFDPERPLPEKASRIYTPTPENIKLLSIFTDVFDCFFRFLSPVFENHCNLDEEKFWSSVATNIIEYQRRHPEMEHKFKKYNLFASEFARSCLNRLQLSNNKQMVNLSDPHKNLKLVGTLENPVAAYAEKSEYETDLPSQADENVEFVLEKGIE